MQKILSLLVLIIITTQSVLAQQTTVSAVYLKNGSVVKGKVFNSKTSDRVKVETPDGSTVFFTKNAIKEVIRENISSRPTKEAETTVYLRNGSIINGTITNMPDGERMKIETPTGSVLYFTERSVLDISQGGDIDLGNTATTPTRQRQQATDRENATTRQQPSRETAATRNQTAAPNEGQLTDAPKSSGYRGFLDFGYCMKMGDISTSRIEITTSHGFQFNNRFFIGLGLGANIYSDGLYYDSKYYLEEGFKFPPAGSGEYTAENAIDTINMSIGIPIFADFRINFLDKGSIIPFAGLKAGYTMGFFKSEWTDRETGTGSSTGNETSLKGVGFYLQPSVGAKFMVGQSFALNISLGYAFQTFDHYYYPYTNGAYTGPSQKQTKNNGAVNIRLGLEF